MVSRTGRVDAYEHGEPLPAPFPILHQHPDTPVRGNMCVYTCVRVHVNVCLCAHTQVCECAELLASCGTVSPLPKSCFHGTSRARGSPLKRQVQTPVQKC